MCTLWGVSRWRLYLWRMGRRDPPPEIVRQMIRQAREKGEELIALAQELSRELPRIEAHHAHGREILYALRCPDDWNEMAWRREIEAEIKRIRARGGKGREIPATSRAMGAVSSN
ncbi:MAG: hypothetical protein ACREE4_10720, partial [Stellaceae bacterium]